MALGAPPLHVTCPEGPVSNNAPSQLPEAGIEAMGFSMLYVGSQVSPIWTRTSPNAFAVNVTVRSDVDTGLPPEGTPHALSVIVSVPVKVPSQGLCE